MKLLDRMMEAAEAAEELAVKSGAVAYLMNDSVDAGGVLALQFPKNRILLDHLWEKTDHDGETYYSPKVGIKTDIMLKSDALEYVKKNPYAKVGEEELTFEAVRGSFSREEAAALAEVELTTPSLEGLGRIHRIAKKDLRMISLGAQIDAVLPDASEEIRDAVRLTMKEDRQISETLEDKPFALVRILSGHAKAIQVYEEWEALPCVPEGAVNCFLKCKSQTHRCGLMEHGSYIYVTSMVEIDNPELETSSQEEFSDCSLL